MPGGGLVFVQCLNTPQNGTLSCTGGAPSSPHAPPWRGQAAASYPQSFIPITWQAHLWQCTIRWVFHADFPKIWAKNLSPMHVAAVLWLWQAAEHWSCSAWQQCHHSAPPVPSVLLPFVPWYCRTLGPHLASMHGCAVCWAFCKASEPLKGAEGEEGSFSAFPCNAHSLKK